MSSLSHSHFTFMSHSHFLRKPIMVQFKKWESDLLLPVDRKTVALPHRMLKVPEISTKWEGDVEQVGVRLVVGRVFAVFLPSDCSFTPIFIRFYGKIPEIYT